MNIAMAIMFGIWATLLATPLIASIFVIIIPRCKTPCQILIYAAIGINIVLVASCAYFGVSFTTFEANAIAFSLAYMNTAFLAFSVFRIKPKAVGIILGIICMLPFIGGLLLATVGGLGVFFITGNYLTSYETTLQNDIACRIRVEGNAIYAGGTRVSLYRPLLPGIEFKVAERHFFFGSDDQEPYGGDEETCRKLLEGYNAGNK